jgi:hypothetical protein
VLLVVALLVTLDLALGGCVSLPRTGQVKARSVADGTAAETLVDFTPVGPQPGSRPPTLVDRWLQSMTATPPDTVVARRFLTRASGSRWRPERRTVVYGSRQLAVAPGGRATLRLRDVVELDDRGAWRGDPTGGRGLTYRLRLVREGGEWRISDPPDQLLIPRTHLDHQYQQSLLYFVDPTSQVLVPEPVYVPRGRRAPTLLVKALLTGPQAALADVERTFVPPGTALDGVTVPVSRTGTAEVPLTAQARDARGAQLELMFAQLAWTLGQVPGVVRMRVTVDGRPVDLPGSPAVVGIDDFSEVDPLVVWSSTDLYGVRDGRVVTSGSRAERRISGPFGALALGARSIAVDPLAQHVAEVSRDGSTVREADRDGVPGRAARRSDVRTVYRGGDRVLRPAYDLHGQLWVMDRTAVGAQLSVVRRRVSQRWSVPGVTGADVRRFVLSRDGTRLVAEVRRGGTDRLVMARVRRDLRGQVAGVTAARRIAVEGLPDRILDVAWRSPTELAVLVAPSAGTSEVLVAKVDGSSTAAELSTDAALFRGRAVGIVTSPAPETPLSIRTVRGRYYTLSGQGHWQASPVRRGLLAATYVG